MNHTGPNIYRAARWILGSAPGFHFSSIVRFHTDGLRACVIVNFNSPAGFFDATLSTMFARMPT